jgi:2-polyprenyl-3-methyl-5-hydroxy-6-metoxy-1,4-benzoquinol methylase
VQMTDDEFSALYTERYFFGDEYRDYIADKKPLQKNFARRLAVLRNYLDRARHKDLLEIGSAYGFFLEAAKDDFRAVLGVDVSEEGVKYSRETLNVNALHVNFLDHDFGDRKFDVVCLWDTIEHLGNPFLYMEKISRLTEKGALITLTTGDVESLTSRIKKDKWRLIHPPTHAHYFSKRTLTRMLNKYGFDVVYRRYCGFFRSVDNIAYNIFVLRKKMPRIYDAFRKMGITGFNLYMNLYDIVYVIARKR